jgi:hypothetical protein
MTNFITNNSSILNIFENVQFDDNIVGVEIHQHLPYASMSYGYHDEIRLPIVQKDLLTLPGESYIHIEGTFTNSKYYTLDFNAIISLFSEIRYELYGIEIDRTNLLSIATTMKALLSMNQDNSYEYQAAGFDPKSVGYWIEKFSDKIENKTDKDNHKENLNFKIDIPLKYLLGFADNYRKLLIFGRQELILKRDANDNNSIIQKTGNNWDATQAASSPPSITINVLSWKVPYIKLTDSTKSLFLSSLKKKQIITVPFRQWVMFEYPTLPSPTSHINWTVKMSSNVERPISIILAFQTDRKGKIDKAYSQFDHITLSEFKIFFNSTYVPYEPQYANFKQNNYSSFYRDFINFPVMYHNAKNPSNIFSMEDFKDKYPLFVANLIYRDGESFKNGVCDVRVEIKTIENIPANTTCYAFLLQERIITYDPILEQVVKVL